MPSKRKSVYAFLSFQEVARWHAFTTALDSCPKSLAEAPSHAHFCNGASLPIAMLGLPSAFGERAKNLKTLHKIAESCCSACVSV